MLQSYSGSLQFQIFLVESTLQINCVMLFPTVFSWRNWLLMTRTGVQFTGKELAEWPSSSSSSEWSSIQLVFSHLQHFPGLNTGASFVYIFILMREGIKCTFSKFVASTKLGGTAYLLEKEVSAEGSG